MKHKPWAVPKIKPCRECGRPILRGEISREQVYADTLPLTIDAQLIALRARRRLWEIRLADRMELFPYSVERISDSTPAIVVADHVGCIEWPAFAIDREANDKLFAYHHPDPAPMLFEPPF